MRSDTAGRPGALRPTRRTLVRTAAWTAPVLATVAAAPAFAASQCQAQTIDFSSYATGTAYPNGATFTSGLVTATLNLSGDTGAASNGTIYATTSSTKELRFYDLNSAKTSQTIRFTFNQPVTNLTIKILDIDQSSNYDDFVLVNTPGYTYVAGASVDGDGRKKNSQFHSATGSAVADGSGLADVTLSYASATQFSITYSQGDGTITGNPHIGIRSMSFTPSTC